MIRAAALRRAALAIAACAASAANIACGSSGADGDAGGGRDGVALGLDGTAPGSDAPPGQAGCDHEQPFFVPRALTQVNTEAEEWAGWLTPDELTLYVSTERGDPTVDIYVATREAPDGDFGLPVAVPGLSEKEVAEAGASLAADGETVHFHTNTAAPFMNEDVNLVDAKFEGTSVSLTVLPGVNTEAIDQNGYYLDEDRVVYFSTTRNGTWDIYRAERASASVPFASAAPVLAHPNRDELHPAVTADELTLYLLLDTELQVATRASRSVPFGDPVVVPELSSPGDDAPSWVSPDGCRIIISSDREGGLGLRDLYSARRAPL